MTGLVTVEPVVADWQVQRIEACDAGDVLVGIEIRGGGVSGYGFGQADDEMRATAAALVSALNRLQFEPASAAA